MDDYSKIKPELLKNWFKEEKNVNQYPGAGNFFIKDYKGGKILVIDKFTDYIVYFVKDEEPMFLTRLIQYGSSPLFYKTFDGKEGSNVMDIILRYVDKVVEYYRCLELYPKNSEYEYIFTEVLDSGFELGEVRYGYAFKFDLSEDLHTIKQVNETFRCLINFNTKFDLPSNYNSSYTYKVQDDIDKVFDEFKKEVMFCSKRISNIELFTIEPKYDTDFYTDCQKGTIYLDCYVQIILK